MLGIHLPVATRNLRRGNAPVNKVDRLAVFEGLRDASPMTSKLRESHDIGGLQHDLGRFGYCMAKRVLDESALCHARSVVERHAAGAGKGSRRSADSDEWLLTGDQWVLLIAGECGLDHIATHPLALSLAKYLLGELVLLSGYTAHIIHPGNEAMDLHTDQWWLPRATVPGGPPSRPGDITRAVRNFGPPTAARHSINPAVVINVMWAISDFTAANGCTRLVPGSHLSGTEPDPDCVWETVHAEVPAGSVVIWDARTWHASGRNSESESRIGISITYCGPQFRQLQNHTLAIRPETHSALDETMRALLGFRLFASYGATVDDEAEFALPGYERD